MQENRNEIKPDGYSESHGTGVISSLVFMVAVIILMVILSHFMNG